MINRLYSICMTGTAYDSGPFWRRHSKARRTEEIAKVLRALDMVSDDPVVRGFRASQFIAMLQSDPKAFQELCESDEDNTYFSTLPYTAFSVTAVSGGEAVAVVGTTMPSTYTPHGKYALVYRDGVLLVTPAGKTSFSVPVAPDGWVVLDNTIKIMVPAAWASLDVIDLEFVLTPTDWPFDVSRIMQALENASSEILEEVDNTDVVSVCLAAAKQLLWSTP